jgi:hypothetical protein
MPARPRRETDIGFGCPDCRTHASSTLEVLAMSAREVFLRYSEALDRADLAAIT